MELIKVSNVFRLCFLVTLFHGRVIKAGNDSPNTGPINLTTPFTEPNNVKDALDLLGKLITFDEESGVLVTVAKMIAHKTRDYLKATATPSETVEKNIEDLVKGVSELRERLLKYPEHYGKYSDLTEADIDAIVDALIRWLPILHSDIYYLYFQTSKDCATINGGSWRSQQLKRFSGSGKVGERVYSWVVNQFDLSHKVIVLQEWLISRGFSPEDLHETNLGKHVAVKTGTSLSGGPLSYAQYGLFLLSPTWHHSNLASAALFLKEFCRAIRGDDFGDYIYDEEYEPVFSACSKMSMGLTFLTKAINPLYHGSANTYKDKFKPQCFPKYAEWLKQNLDNFNKSLEEMLMDASWWTAEVLTRGASPGPFKYGFVFRDSGWDPSMFHELRGVITALTT